MNRPDPQQDLTLTVNIEDILPPGKYLPLSKYAGQLIISNLYNVYFGAWLLGFFVAAFFGSIIYEFITGIKLEQNSTDYFVIVSALVGIITGIGQIVLTENKAKKEKISLYGPGRAPVKNSVLVILAAFSVYILLNNVITFIFRFYLGPASIIKPESPYPFTVLDYLDTATNFSAGQIKQNILFIVIGYTVYFVSIEYLLRGLIGGELRKWRAGAGPAIIIPAFIQVMMFHLELVQLSKGTYYYYLFLMTLTQALLAGIVFWITKKLWYPIIFTLMVHGLPRGEKFHTALLRLMPASMGTYDPLTPPDTVVDKLDQTIQTFLLILMFLAFLIPFVFSKQITNLFSEIYHSTKIQWKGMLGIIITVAAINIAIYFFFSMAQDAISLIIIFIVIGLIISILSNLILSFSMGQQSPELILLYQLPETLIEKIQIEPDKDVQAFNNKPAIYERPIKFGIIMAFVYLYGSFMVASYRNFEGLSILQGIVLALFIYLLPAIYIFAVSYLLAIDLYKREQFDKESYKHLKILRAVVLGIIMVFSIMWSSLGEFHPRIIGYLATYLKISPKDKDEKIKERILKALNSVYRYQTIIYMTREKEDIIRKAADEWQNEELSPVVTSALMGWKGMKKEIEPEVLKEYYDKNEKNEDKLYGLALAIGLGKYNLTNILFKLLRAKTRNVRYVAYWAIGQVSNKASVAKLARAIEKENDYELREFATKILLNIDPNYPLLRFEEENEDFAPVAFQEIIE